MTFEQRDSENLIDVWGRFKRMIKGCPHHCITGCVLMEQFYFGLSRDIQQSVDIVFIGGMLRSSYNQIKTTLDDMTSNIQEWRDDSFEL